MIYVKHELHFETPAQVADWLARQGYSGTLTARVRGRDVTLTFGQPPAGATVGDVGYASPYEACAVWLRRIREAADGSAATPPREGV